MANNMPFFNQYNEFNNIYIEPKKFQQVMAQNHGITTKECNGKLIFVLKLDEYQVVKGQHLAWVILALINRSLQGVHIEFTDSKASNRPTKSHSQEYYGFQYENHIWWLVAFTSQRKYMKL